MRRLLKWWPFVLRRTYEATRQEVRDALADAVRNMHGWEEARHRAEKWKGQYRILAQQLRTLSDNNSP